MSFIIHREMPGSMKKLFLGSGVYWKVQRNY